MIKKYAHWVIKFRWLIIITTFILVGLAAKGAPHLSFTNDYRVFFDGDNPHLIAFENLQDTYSKNDNVMFVLAPKDGQVFTAKTLAAVQWLTHEAWQIPFSVRVDSVTNFQHSFAEEDDLMVGDLVDDISVLSSTDMEGIKQIAINEPLLIKRLISSTAHVTGINVTIQLKGENQQTEGPEVVAKVRALESEMHQRYPDIDVYLTGIVMMNAAFPEAAEKDMTSLIPAMFLVVLITIFILIRLVSGTFATLLVILLSVLTAMGLSGWAGIQLTPPSASAPTIIMTMAVADSIHILVSFIFGMRRGQSKQEAMVESLRINFQPVFLTSVTTAIGFLSMNFSDAPPFHDLGNIVAVGIMVAFVLSITFLPAMMMVLPVNIAKGETRGTKNMEKFGDFVINHRKKLLISMSVLVLGLATFLTNNELNDNFVEYFDDDIQFRRDSDFASENLAGLYLIDYSLKSSESGGVSNPAFLSKVDEFANWYRTQPEVTHVNVITDIFKRLNRNMHGDDPSWHRLPEQRDLAAQYLLLYEMSLPYGLDLNNQINVDKSATRMTVSLLNLSSSEVLALEERAHQWLADNAPASMLTFGASPTVMFANIGYTNIRSMLIGTTVALVLISVILMIALRSVKMGFISLVPNLVPAILAFGLWGLLIGQVGLALSVVAGMTLGIVVDDTVHFLSKYLRARRERGDNAEQAVRYAFSTVGVALFTTSLVLVAGFMILSTSSFELNAGMGLMTAITIGFALLADFLLLPPILMKLDKKEY
ncbi:MAG: MMPL family transporter [Gammaproteobacteria bacterium]|nr:MMPL family transporter [Gammaproteobacteria bacterium]